MTYSVCLGFNPLPDDKFLALSKFKAFADDNFIVAQGVQYFFDRVEKTLGKGENARYKNFPLFQLSNGFFVSVIKTWDCLVMKYCYFMTFKGSPIPTQRRLLTPLGIKPFENTVGKGEIARNEQFLLFPQCFLPV